MKRLTLLIAVFALFSLSSCSVAMVRMFTVNTTTPSVDSAKLHFENDTLAITYNFYGEGPGIGFTVYNKLDKLIYMDWGSSSYIIGTAKYDYGRQGSYEAIPPRTSITHATRINVPVNLAAIAMQRQIYMMLKNAYVDGRSDSFKAKETDFTPVTSPLVFRNYLSVSVDSKTAQQTRYDHQFWITRLRELTKEKYDGTVIDPYTGTSKETNPFADIHTFYITIYPR